MKVDAMADQVSAGFLGGVELSVEGERHAKQLGEARRSTCCRIAA